MRENFPSDIISIISLSMKLHMNYRVVKILFLPLVRGMLGGLDRHELDLSILQLVLKLITKIISKNGQMRLFSFYLLGMTTSFSSWKFWSPVSFQQLAHSSQP